MGIRHTGLGSQFRKPPQIHLVPWDAFVPASGIEIYQKERQKNVNNYCRPAHPPKINCATVDCQPYPDSEGELDCVPVHKDGLCCPEYYCPSTGTLSTYSL
jgi:hypothetical protein